MRGVSSLSGVANAEWPRFAKVPAVSRASTYVSERPDGTRPVGKQDFPETNRTVEVSIKKREIGEHTDAGCASEEASAEGCL